MENPSSSVKNGDLKELNNGVYPNNNVVQPLLTGRLLAYCHKCAIM